MKESTTTRSRKSKQLRYSGRSRASHSVSPSRVIIIPVIIALVVFLLPTSLQAQQNTDFIALVDVSESMFDEHEETVMRVLEEIATEQLSREDMFHLLSFGEAPEYELNTRVDSRENIEQIVSQLLLLQPLETYTDFTAAMKYLVEYVDGLSLSTKKRILIISDGTNDPPPESPYTDAEENRNRVAELSQYMKRNGWDVKVLSFGREEDGEAVPPLLSAIEESFDKQVVVAGSDATTGGDVLGPALTIGFPDKRYSGKRRVTLPFSVTNSGDDGRTLRIGKVLHGTDNLLTEPKLLTLIPGETKTLNLTLRIPEEVGSNAASVEVELVADQGGPIAPAAGTITLRRTQGAAALFSSATPVIWIILGILALILIVIAVRRLFTAAARTSEERERKPAGGVSGTDILTGYGKTGSGADRRGQPLSGTAGQRSSAAGAADVLSHAGTGSASESTIAGKQKDEREEVRLSKAERSAGREAADILSQASARGGAERAPESASGAPESTEASTPEKALQRSGRAHKEKLREQHGRPHLPVRGGTGGGPGAGLHMTKGTGPKVLAALRKEGKMPVEMKVEFQRNQGGINLLWFEEGQSRTVGAPGEADFSISSVPVKGVIGHVVMENGKLVFYSESRRYFPELEKPVRNCLRTPILVRSPETEEEATIRFHEYVHPLERINRIMHLIDSPGAPKFDY